MHQSLHNIKFPIWESPVKNYLSFSAMVYCLILLIFWISDFFTYQHTIISILGTCILIFSNIFEGANLCFSFNGYYRNLSVLFLFTFFTAIGLFFLIILAVVGKMLSPSKILMAILQFIYILYGIAMILASNNKIATKIRHEYRISDTAHSTHENNLFIPNFEIDDYDYNYQVKSIKNKTWDMIENCDTYSSPYFDKTGLISSCMIYSPTESSIDLAASASSNLFIEGIPNKASSELYNINSSLYQGSISINADENEINENNDNNQPYSLLNAEIIM